MDDTPLRRLHVDVKRTVDVSEHQQRVNSASTASTTGKRSRFEPQWPTQIELGPLLFLNKLCLLSAVASWTIQNSAAR